MIEISYDRKKHLVTVKGHARSGEKGRDLVCAAASMLVYTLASDVEKLCADHGRVRKPVCRINEGNALISCKPVHGFESVVTLIFDSVCRGFELLQTQYPDNVRYTWE